MQELMRCVELQEPNGFVTIMDQVITPCIKSAAMCPIWVCQLCQLSCACLHKPKVTKSRAIAEVEGAVSADKYETGDFVSTDQCILCTPG